MVMEIRVPKDAIRAAEREFDATEKELQVRIPQATRQTIRALRRVSQRFLRDEERFTPRYIKRRLRVASSGNNRSLWFGANPIPAEAIRGNISARAGARGLSTKREGAIARSFAIRLRNRPPVGKKLYLHRRSPTLYSRILTNIEEDMELARLMASNEAPAEFRRRLITAIQRGRRPREARA